jgi:1,4-dihydroxy-2-naphthoate octaprenyltransferase
MVASAHNAQPAPPLWRAWLLAARPKTLPAAFAPVLVGTAVAWADGARQPGMALAALLGALAIQVGTNFFNDWADFVQGADDERRIGPARATQQGWLSRRAVLAGCVVAFAAATLCGVVLLARGGWPIVIIGVASILSGLAYTGAPLKLGYRGLGDLFVWVFFGGVAVGGTYWVQALTLTPAVLIAALSTGALATAILVVNNQRDRETDRRAGKRTLVVRFGPTFGRWEYTLLAGFAFIAPAAAWAAGLVGAGWWLSWATLPVAARRVVAIWRIDGAALNTELAATARLLLLFSLALSCGALL